jgi:hypothetical protein
MCQEATPFDKLQKVTLLGKSKTELVSENKQADFYHFSTFKPVIASKWTSSVTNVRTYC